MWIPLAESKTDFLLVTRMVLTIQHKRMQMWLKPIFKSLYLEMYKLLTGKNFGVPIQFKQPLDMLT